MVINTSATLNTRWGAILIGQLVAQGIDYFCIAPGSRSSPLTLACARHPQAHPMIHFDERGLAFHALGYAKATGKAACLIVTSGTAVLNLLPAIVEAHQERVPLILLTADRPPELKDCGANQSCEQQKSLTPYCRWQIELPCPCTEIPERFLVTTITTAVQRAHASPSGPVQINCMFREPLTEMGPLDVETSCAWPHNPSVRVVHPHTIERIASLLEKSQRGVIVVGSLPHHLAVQPILKLADKLQFPVFASLLSQVRCIGKHSAVIPFTKGIAQADCILHLGDRLISASLEKWLKGHAGIPYLQITDHPQRQDPFHLVTDRTDGDPIETCAALTHLIEQKSSVWLDQWKSIEKPVGISSILATHLDPNWGIFFGNSMPIREAEQYFFPTHPCGPVFANRGVSGIDGNIATAIGIAQGLQQPTVALIGDLTALHDINSLAQLREAKHPLFLIIVNNHGGRIFSSLPIAEQFPSLLEKFWVTPHPYSFAQAAALFQIPYYHPSTSEELASIFETSQSAMIEVDEAMRLVTKETPYLSCLSSCTVS